MKISSDNVFVGIYMSAIKKIQARAKQLKLADPSLKHTEAVKLASKQLREEGVFKGKPKKKQTMKSVGSKPKKRKAAGWNPPSVNELAKDIISNFN